MKVFLARPLKVNGSWKKAGDEINITDKKEQKRLENKGAIIIPFSGSKSDEDQEKAKG